MLLEEESNVLELLLNTIHCLYVQESKVTAIAIIKQCFSVNVLILWILWLIKDSEIYLFHKYLYQGILENYMFFQLIRSLDKVFIGPNVMCLGKLENINIDNIYYWCQYTNYYLCILVSQERLLLLMLILSDCFLIFIK